MKCYRHNNNDANGMCKFCCKAVCEECAIDGGYGLACSEECIEELYDQKCATRNLKHLYGLEGSTNRQFLTGLFIVWTIGILFFVSGIYNSIENHRVDFASLIPAGMFLITAFLSYIFYRFNLKKLD